MEEVAVKVKCPYCGSVLNIKRINNYNIVLKCPVCKQSAALSDYKSVMSKQSADNTEYSTEINDGKNYIIGEVILLPEGSAPSFKLKLGRNVIGRKCSSSKSDFQIDTNGKNRMSREHLVIDVKNEPHIGYIHCVSLYKEKVNDTFIGNEKLEYGDCIIIKNGDIINLPDASIMFKMRDNDETEI